VLPLGYAAAYNVLGRQGDVGRARERLLAELAGPEPCLLHVMAVSVEQPQVDWDSGGWLRCRRRARPARCCCARPHAGPVGGRRRRALHRQAAIYLLRPAARLAPVRGS
jgi:hypothetical protein